MILTNVFFIFRSFVKVVWEIASKKDSAFLALAGSFAGDIVLEEIIGGGKGPA
jgi:hypothetical protein